MDELQIHVSYTGNNDEIAVISARGYIDSTTTEKIETELLQQIALKKYRIIVDLEEINYINSSGWGVFLREIKDIRSKRGDLVLLKMTPDVRNVFETMEFSRILKSFDTFDEAIKSFGGEE